MSKLARRFIDIAITERVKAINVNFDNWARKESRAAEIAHAKHHLLEAMEATALGLIVYQLPAGDLGVEDIQTAATKALVVHVYNGLNKSTDDLANLMRVYTAEMLASYATPQSGSSYWIWQAAEKAAGK